MKLKKGDEIIITGGKDLGKKGKIEKIYPKTQQVLVTGHNLYKKHLKRRDEKHPGGIVDYPKPLPTARVSLVCPKCKKITRIGYAILKQEKQRVCKKCNQIL